jgi:hypothetical protein
MEVKEGELLLFHTVQILHPDLPGKPILMRVLLGI